MFGSGDHHCPGFYEDVLTHYGTACPVDEKSAETVLPANSTEGSDAGKCSPGSFTNTNGECGVPDWNVHRRERVDDV